MKTHQQTLTDETYGILNPSYEPDGDIGTVDEALSLISDAEISGPDPANPKTDIQKWREVIDSIRPEVYTQIAEEAAYTDISKAFTALSYTMDENTLFTVNDLCNIKTGPNVENEEEYRPHVENAVSYTFEMLPPATTALLGSWIGELRVYTKDYYKNEMLPEGEKWGGLHYPHRKEIQMYLSYCRHDFSEEEYPDPDASKGCAVIHELAHAVHNIYGMLRPGDSGYEYPSSSKEIESTGCIGVDLHPYQAKFTLEANWSYGYHHLNEVEDFRWNGYGRTHPVEGFACAFDALLRQGTETIKKQYPHYYKTLSLLL